MWWYTYPGYWNDRFFTYRGREFYRCRCSSYRAVTAEGAENFVYAQQDLIRELRSLMNNMPNLAQAMKKSIEENAEMKKQIEDYIREKSMRLKRGDRGESFGEQWYQGYAVRW